ncbi:PAS domain S-box protein, partial [bacterium]|nr:PAS domain S-box protein [bacterium]
MGDGPAGADRSTRQQAQDAFFAVVESAPFGMHFYDLLPDGRLVFSGANPAADRILGVANAQFLGKTIEEAFPPLVDTEVPARYREAAAEGRPWRTEQLSYRDNVIVGAFEVTAFQIGPRRMATVFQDITERKLAEVALTREKERLAVTLGSIADGVLSTDAEGRITLLNRMAVHLTGWSTDAAAGRQVEDVLALFGACGQESVDNPVRAALARGEVTALPPNTVARTTGGREFAVEGAAAPIRDEAGQVVGAVLAVRDTTERQRLEEIERRSQRLESLGLLAGGIAHDFNNMLSGLFGYIDLARAASEEPASVRRYMTNAASVLDRARGLAYQLLTFARGSAPVRRAVHLDELLHQTVPFALTGSAIEARFDMAPDL